MNKLCVICVWLGLPCLVLTTVRTTAVSAVSWQRLTHPIQTLWAIMYLTIDPIKTWCVRKRCVGMCRMASLSPIFGKINIHRSAVENVLKNDDLHTFCDATPPVFIGSQIGEQKVNPHIVMHVFCIHHFLSRKIPKYLGNCPWNCGLPRAENDWQMSKKYRGN